MKECNQCGESKELSEFYRCKRYYQSCCKKCSISMNKEWSRKNRDKTNLYNQNYRKKNKNTPHLKAQYTLDSMRRTCRKKGFDLPEFTKQEVEKLIVGRCAVTEIPFEFSQEKFYRSPWTPTPDRIDSSKGYTKANTQWVCYMYNVMKSDFTDDVINKFVRALIDVGDF